jgi:DNA-binding response OmpR family regulator
MDTPRTILIIEDDEFLRSLAAKRLEKEGYKIAVAVDGESALNVAVETKPALILLDLLLPGLDGFEVSADLHVFIGNKRLSKEKYKAVKFQEFVSELNKTFEAAHRLHL